MKAQVLHDKKGKILSVVVTGSDIDLELVPKKGQSVLQVDAKDVGLGDVAELTPRSEERVRASSAKTKAGMRVDVRAGRLVRAKT